MHKNYLVVDGYNILNNWTDLAALMRESLEEARSALIDILTEYAQISGDLVILVFDAYQPKGKRTIEDDKGIQIVYTSQWETADEFIEKLIAKYGRKRRIRVATSDSMIQTISLARGATRISAQELRQIIIDAKMANKKIRVKMKETSHRGLVRISEDGLKAIEKLLKDMDGDRKKKKD